MGDKKKKFPTQPSLVGKKIYLRPATPDDVANFHHWYIQSEPLSQTFEPLPILTISEATDLYKKTERNIDHAVFTIVSKEENTPLGKITYSDYNPLNQSARLGVLIDEDHRKKGYAKDALLTLINYLFRYRNLNKVYGEISEHNEDAVKLVDSIGFKKDGTLRAHHYYDGEFNDIFIYSVMKFEI